MFTLLGLSAVIPVMHSCWWASAEGRCEVVPLSGVAGLNLVGALAYATRVSNFSNTLRGEWSWEANIMGDI